jgi:hypothetical protein
MPSLAFLSLTMYCNSMDSQRKTALINDSRVQRLLMNPNWAPAAQAAIKYLTEGVECPIASWRKSSTWAQVKMVWEETNKSS